MPQQTSFFLKHQLATMAALFSSASSRDSHRSLMYHSIYSDRSITDDIFSVNLKNFTQQVNILKELDLSIVRFDEAKAGISITFDDGFLDNLTLAAPILFEAKLPFTVFVVSDYVDPAHPQFVNKEQLKKMASNPLVTIGSHGKTHRPLATLPLEEALEDLRQSKIELENIIGKEVSTMSFPHGSFNENILAGAEKLGFKKCGTSFPYPNQLNQDSVQVDRQCIYFCESKLSYKQKLEGKWDRLWRK
ncbi:MAG: polysaccharide deacetylase family protein [Bacteriovorax sp.]|nr:polysaccharide deacetylase family protein [Bacteriovorax sp.]